ncbi:NXPE family member 4-like isoform X3 [Triplophysa rosa]|uniref:NXPE family member 4-like isoform X3 n=1 Tax=Triplophysa rosa TaxID=992332 RepID=UPI00254639B8|nr:NXPE family member 4-like isoform X3 [Triplophysa rosa]
MFYYHLVSFVSDYRTRHSMCLVLLFLLTSFIMISWKWPVVRFHTHIPKAAPPNNSSRISAIDMGISQEEWDRLQKALDWPSPDHEITQLNLSTSPVHTTFSIVRLNDTYNVGDKICVTITARDHNNNLKTYGGDFFQAKLFNSKLKASVYGEVIDHRNGTYTVDLLLPWEGQAQVSVRLVHSCEVVRILKKYRETSFPRSHYYGYFVGPGPKGTRISEKVECNLKWGSRGSWSKGNCCCEYKDVKTETVWQCDRPKQLSCDHWVHHEAGALESPLNSFEMQLFASTLTNVEITGDTKTINVLPNITSIVKTERCRSGLITPVPAGFYFQDVWKSFVCNTQLSCTGNVSKLQPAGDPVMKALQSIQLSLSNLSDRIQTLESQPSPTSTISSLMPVVPKAFAATAPSTAEPAALIPRRSLATALPAPTTGAPFFPPAAAISPQLCTQILSGNDITWSKFCYARRAKINI